MLNIHLSPFTNGSGNPTGSILILTKLTKKVFFLYLQTNKYNYIFYTILSSMSLSVFSPQRKKNEEYITVLNITYILSVFFRIANNLKTIFVILISYFFIFYF